MSRLSFDSSRGSSEAGEDQDVELDEVLPHRTKRNRARSNETARAIPVYSPSYRDHLGVELERPGTPPTKVIRTVQLQPSPSMVIPAPISGDKRESDQRRERDHTLPSNSQGSS